MIKKYNIWFDSLTPLMQFAMSFISNWFFWLAAWLIAERLLFDEQRSWEYHLLHATWMSLLTTVVFNWRTAKALFKNGIAPQIADDTDKLM